ncbi:hypothetical protein LEP1GSC170_5075 [Leptospira interrogans serovar Bataviae str. HAI135]|uniref:Uncharacterized protein n=1 Tax=Leptospira noguchii serovar Autumnalis str. ZUN142 TaxID=1085540 RepID=M6U5F1_9LEPT|nr:hypothetical protein LEP1GSC170_5075 [Leptospira interrogans serovar Bataviae str. HAI135]EMO40267.1 hypothetical protein LEP1GSC186_3951 [Leptospira noguchii serovar Autumnalis str. ZUN142]
MFLTVIRTILWILSAGVVGYITFLTVISNSKAYFHALSMEIHSFQI